MTSSLEGLPTKAKETPSTHEVKVALLDTNPVCQSLRGTTNIKKNDKSQLKARRNDKNNFFEFLTNLQKHHNILDQPIKVQ